MPDTVHVEIVLPAGVPPNAASVVVRIEDVSRADAASTVLSEHRLRTVALSAGAVLPIDIEVPFGQLDLRRMYVVTVHVDVNGSGDVDRGDLVSTQSHPVLTRGAGRSVRIPVRLV